MAGPDFLYDRLFYRCKTGHAYRNTLTIGMTSNKRLQPQNYGHGALCHS